MIDEAIKVGYRLFDTATVYGNEEMLGNAVKRSGIKGESILLSSKVNGNKQGY